MSLIKQIGGKEKKNKHSLPSKFFCNSSSKPFFQIIESHAVIDHD